MFSPGMTEVECIILSLSDERLKIKMKKFDWPGNANIYILLLDFHVITSVPLSTNSNYAINSIYYENS